MFIKDAQEELIELASLPPTSARAIQLRARHDFLFFCKFVLEDAFKPFAAHRKIAEVLQKAATGEYRKLIISCPPRTGKSLLVSQAFPAWTLGRSPQSANMLASYNRQLSRENARKTLQIMKLERYKLVFPEVKLVSEKVVEQIRTTADGVNRITPASADCTGLGFGTLTFEEFPGFAIMDDLLASGKSSRILDATWEWTSEQFLTRAKPNSVLISMGTRFNESDITGRLLEAEGEWSPENPDGWRTLIIPALCSDEKTDPLGRSIGESHWPEYFPVEALENTRKQIGEKLFQTLYQCNPLSTENAIFHRGMFNYVKPHPEYRVKFIAADTAFSTKRTADESALVVFGLTVDGASLHILDYESGQWGFPELEKRIIQLSIKHGVNLTLIEEKASGQSLIQTLSERRMSVLPLKATQDKVARAHTVTSVFDNAEVWFNSEIPNLQLIEKQLLEFPMGKRDDIVDAIVHGVSYYISTYRRHGAKSVDFRFGSFRTRNYDTP